jgi:pimeloyl-ACP methyl ester carboxylesterase
MGLAGERHQRTRLDELRGARELLTSSRPARSSPVHRVPRRILAVVTGIGVSTGVILAVEGLNARRYPTPEGFSYENAEQMRAYIASLPPAAFATVLTAWVLGTFLGGAVTARVAGARPRLFAGIIAGVVGVGAVINIASFPHPLWMVLSAAFAIPLAYFAAVRVTPNAPTSGGVA